LLLALSVQSQLAAASDSGEVIKAASIDRGLALIIDDSKLAAELARGGRFLVHLLVSDSRKAAAADLRCDKGGDVCGGDLFEALGFDSVRPAPAVLPGLLNGRSLQGPDALLAAVDLQGVAQRPESRAEVVDIGLGALGRLDGPYVLDVGADGVGYRRAGWQGVSSPRASEDSSLRSFSRATW